MQYRDVDARKAATMELEVKVDDLGTSLGERYTVLYEVAAPLCGYSRTRSGRENRQSGIDHPNFYNSGRNLLISERT